MRPLSTNPVADEAGYRVEDGIVVDEAPRPTRRRTREEFVYKTRLELEAEELAWAARSGPVTTRRKS